MNRQIRYQLLTLVVCFCCVAPLAVAEREMADEFIIAHSIFIESLDPHVMGTIEIGVNWHVTEPLVWMHPDGSFSPMLAESWTTSDNGLEWTFKLRSGVKFSDGTDFNAEDVAANLQRQIDAVKEGAFEGTQHAFLYKDVERVEIVDKLTVKVICKEPIGPLLNNLAILLMMSKESVEKFGTNLVTEIVPGTGPYIKESQVPDRGVVLVANPNYWQEGLPVIPRLVFRGYLEAATMLIAFRAGEVDACYPIDRDILPLLIADKNITVEAAAFYEILFFGLKVDEPPFDNLKARQALNLAIDRQLIVDTLMGGAGCVMGAYIQEGMPGYAPQLAPPEQDLEKARQLLAESGYDGRTLRFIAPPAWIAKCTEICEALASMMRDAGFNVELEIMEGGAFRAARKGGDYHLHFLVSHAVTGEPQRYLAERVVSDVYKSGWVNEECFALINEAGRTVNPAKKEELYVRIQEIMYEELAPQIYLFQPDVFYAYRSNVEGFTLLPTYMWYVPTVVKYKD